MPKSLFPSTQTTCSIRLYCNIPFDNTYKNHSLISHLFTYNNTALSSRTAQLLRESFLDRKDYTKVGQPRYYPKHDLTGEYNFDVPNGMTGSVTLELTPAQTTANYLRLTCGTDVFYYFITGIRQNNYDTYTLSLELDVLMTFQDEFLGGMKDVPVFTARKHCVRYTSNGLMPYCADLKTGDDAFAGVKPTLITDVKNLHFENTQMKNIEGVFWLYVCLDVSLGSGTLPNDNPLYKYNYKTFPFAMVAIPLNKGSVTYSKSDNTKSITTTRADINKAITKLIGSGHAHGCKVSPYPPFCVVSNAQTISLDASGNMTIKSSSVTDILSDEVATIYEMGINGNYLWYGTSTNNYASGDLFTFILNGGGMLIVNQNESVYELDELTPTALGFANTTKPSITSTRYPEPKLLFAPFKKYLLTAQYASNGYEFFPELIFSTKATADNGHYFWFDTHATAYIGDNNFYTRVYDSTTNVFNNYKYEKLGLSSTVNYIMPSGTNALDVFNATQAQAFYQSKVASGITSGLTMAGGVASIVLGAGMIGASGVTAGTSSIVGAGMIATGVGAIASGTAGVANTIKSADAKIEDLKNTPDSLNVTGSNFFIDESINSDTKCMPYVVIYDVVDVIKQHAEDYFYQYGYQVARDCYFNTELKYDNSGNGYVDNNLFGRDIFNYIQIQEDITNKINADIPLIVKQKISNIFNSGITLWSFFTFTTLWTNPDVVLAPNIDNWFMKNNLDNTEYQIQIS